MESIATYIAMPGNALEAFTHWHAVLGGDLFVARFGELADQSMGIEISPDDVAHIQLTTPGGVLAGCDAMDGSYPVEGTAYSLLYTVDSIERGQEIFDAFVSAGGRVQMPFANAPWGQHYGQVFDQFNVMWAIACDAE